MNNTKIATMLTIGGLASGITIGGLAPIILLSSGLGITIAEIINILDK